jgi:glycosyltransferase involved in cell wall biosynthesis
MLSIVVPLYRSEENLPDVFRELGRIAQEAPGQVELVFVNDGSPDRSAEVVAEHLERLPAPAQLIRLSRNFGAFSAIADQDKMVQLARQHPPKQISARGKNGEALPAPELVSWKPREIVIRHRGAAGIVTVNHLYYPHWKAMQSDGGKALAISADAYGMMRVEVPAGNYDLRMVLEKSPAEVAGDGATVAGLLMVGLLWVGGRRKGD